MPAKVVVIGLDAAQATLFERWSKDGDFPAVAELIERGAVCDVTRNPMETLPGAIWPELTTGIAAPKLVSTTTRGSFTPARRGCVRSWRTRSTRSSITGASPAAPVLASPSWM